MLLLRGERGQGRGGAWARWDDAACLGGGAARGRRGEGGRGCGEGGRGKDELVSEGPGSVGDFSAKLVSRRERRGDVPLEMDDERLCCALDETCGKKKEESQRAVTLEGVEFSLDSR